MSTIDSSTLDFMEIVVCEPWEVLDIPEQKPVTEADRRRGAGSFQIYFGKYKGLALNEIPRDYLEWLVEFSPTKNRSSFNKARRMAAVYLDRAIPNY